MLTLFFDAATELSSEPDETEAAFRARVTLKDRETRDAEKERLRQKFAPKIATLTERIRRAEQQVQAQEQQASDAKLQTGISVLGTIAGALFGRKTISAGTLGKATTAARGMGRTMRESSDVKRAQETLGDLQGAAQGDRGRHRSRDRRPGGRRRAADSSVHGDGDPAQEDPRHPRARRPRLAPRGSVCQDGAGPPSIGLGWCWWERGSGEISTMSDREKQL